MNKTFLEHWEGLSADGKKSLAESAVTSTNHLSQVAHGHRNAGLSLYTRLVNSGLPPEMVRPDIHIPTQAAS